VAVSRDSSWLAAGGLLGEVTIWRTDDWDHPLATSGHPARIDSLDFSPDGRTLASAAMDGSIRLWHVATGQELVTLGGHSKAACQVKFSPDGRSLATAGVENTAEGRHEVHLWRADATLPARSQSVE
jgi:WD40 repeat protein